MQMKKFKYKLSEMSKTASAKDAEKELNKPSDDFKAGQVIFSKDGLSKSTITNVDPITGTVSWDIERLPGLDKLFQDATDLVKTAKVTYTRKKEDKKLKEFYEDIRMVRNAIRTHLRNEYPDEYDRMTSISEAEEKSNRVPEAALILPRGEEVILQAEEQDYKRGLKVTLMDDGGYKVKYWYGDDIKTYPAEVEVDGQSIKKDAVEVDILFHPELGEISTSAGAGAYLTPYAFRKKGKKANIKAYKELGYTPVKETNPGATLGPGPKAGKDGVKDNYYIKGFKYKLVPSKIKGSGLEVKQLFEKN